MRLALRLVLISLVGALVAGTILVFAWPVEADRARIGIERHWRSEVAKLGFALPGTPDLSDLKGRLASQGLKAGDAIFMPPMWWHHVRSNGALNVLVNYWFGQRQDRSVVEADERGRHQPRFRRQQRHQVLDSQLTVA